MSKTRTHHRLVSASGALALGLLLAACSTLPANDESAAVEAGAKAQAQSGALQTQAASGAEAVTTASGSGHHSVVTETLNCVPTKEAQALGLTRTERVVAAYHIPNEQEAGEASVRLTLGGKTFTLREAPSASGSRYVGGDSLVSGQKGFSWHTKRNEAILSALEASGGVDAVVDGPLLYRCMTAAS